MEHGFPGHNRQIKQVSQKIRVDTLRWAAGVECVAGGKSVQQEGVVFRRTCLVYREGRFMLFFLYVNKYVHKSHRKDLFLILKCLFYLNVYQLKAKICILVGMQSMHAYFSLNNTLWSNSLSSRILKDFHIPQQFHESLENSTLVSPSIECF